MSSPIVEAPCGSGLWVSNRGDEVFLATTLSTPPTYLVTSRHSNVVHEEVLISFLRQRFRDLFGNRRWRQVSYDTGFPNLPAKPLLVCAYFLSGSDVSWWAVFTEEPVPGSIVGRKPPFATRGGGTVPVYALTVVDHEDNDPEAVRLIEEAKAEQGQ